MLLLMTSLEARMNREPTMTVVPAKMIMGENEPRSRTRRAPAVGPPSSDLNDNQQSPSTIMGGVQIKIKIKISCTHSSVLMIRS